MVFAARCQRPTGRPGLRPCARPGTQAVSWGMLAVAWRRRDILRAAATCEGEPHEDILEIVDGRSAGSGCRVAGDCADSGTEVGDSAFQNRRRQGCRYGCAQTEEGRCGGQGRLDEPSAWRTRDPYSSECKVRSARFQIGRGTLQSCGEEAWDRQS